MYIYKKSDKKVKKNKKNRIEWILARPASLAQHLTDIGSVSACNHPKWPICPKCLMCLKWPIYP